jgi:hypothetical protein
MKMETGSNNVVPAKAWKTDPTPCPDAMKTSKRHDLLKADNAYFMPAPKLIGLTMKIALYINMMK